MGDARNEFIALDKATDTVLEERKEEFDRLGGTAGSDPSPSR